MSRDYETPDDYAGVDYDARDERDAYDDRIGDDDRAEAALRRWEEQREMPYENDEQQAELVTRTEAAVLLGCHHTTVGQYANAGLVDRIVVAGNDGRRRHYYRVSNLAEFDARYPRGADGTRPVGIAQTVSTGITRKRLSNGEDRYRLNTVVNGKRYCRTFKTLRGAERHRDRLISGEAVATKPVQDTPQVGVIRRLFGRLGFASVERAA